MELKEFIKSVLVDVCIAVREAKISVKDSAVAPSTVDGKAVDDGQLISFDISVAVSDSLEGEGGGKIQVLSFGASGGAKINREMTNVNKISFQVPVYFNQRFID